MSFWCLQFPPKNERKQVDLRFHSSKVEFVFSFFGGNVGLKKSFRLCLTFSFVLKTMPKFWVSISLLDFKLEEKSRNSGWYFSIRIEHEVYIEYFLKKTLFFILSYSIFSFLWLLWATTRRIKIVSELLTVRHIHPHIFNFLHNLSKCHSRIFRDNFITML